MRFVIGGPGGSMDIRYSCARVLSALSTWGLKKVFHRAAGNFPGQIALKADPSVLAHARSKCQHGSICVVGTNGKTTCTNLLADMLQTAGNRVICNRGGANLKAGIVAALLQSPQSDWAVMECDEMWLAHVLPDLQSDYVLLLNLFADQLDRVGDISHVQNSIVKALESSPRTTLLYNGDDPRCASIAQRVSNKSVAFGIAQRMDITPVQPEPIMCHQCGALLDYQYVQYGQLGDYACPGCGFQRPELHCAAEQVSLGTHGLSFTVDGTALSAPFHGAYMVYNVLACALAARMADCSFAAMQQAINAFNPQNGRLQTYQWQGRQVLLNLAKNPTGFNQNLDIVLQGEGSKAVAFFVNDMEGDGRDVSWLWDIAFESLVDANVLAVYAGGMRAHDLQVRLKYAGIKADLVESADHALDCVQNLPNNVNVYFVANYTALPSAKAALDKRVAAAAASGEANACAHAVTSETHDNAGGATGQADACEGVVIGETRDGDQCANSVVIPAPEPDNTKPPVVIAHLFPDALNLYGDAGNVRILEQRLRWRGVPVQVQQVHLGDTIDFDQVDLVFLGGGSAVGMQRAVKQLRSMKDQLSAFIEREGALLAVCGGYQLLGREWVADNQMCEGADVLGMTSRLAQRAAMSHEAQTASVNNVSTRASAVPERLVGNVALQTPLAQHPVLGYENHTARTYIDEDMQPFGRVISATGYGNNEYVKADGIQYKHVLGTYLHGPLLSKNPEIADWLLEKAVAHAAVRTNSGVTVLNPLPDAEELAANAAVFKQINK